MLGDEGIEPTALGLIDTSASTQQGCGSEQQVKDKWLRTETISQRAPGARSDSALDGCAAFQAVASSPRVRPLMRAGA